MGVTVIHTKHWACSRWTGCKMLPACSETFTITSRSSLGLRPKTNPSTDHFQSRTRYTGSDKHTGWGLGTRLVMLTWGKIPGWEWSHPTRGSEVFQLRTFRCSTFNSNCYSMQRGLLPAIQLSTARFLLPEESHCVETFESWAPEGSWKLCFP